MFVPVNIKETNTAFGKSVLGCHVLASCAGVVVAHWPEQDWHRVRYEDADE